MPNSKVSNEERERVLKNFEEGKKPKDIADYLKLN
jgi:hypothetical protein